MATINKDIIQQLNALDSSISLNEGLRFVCPDITYDVRALFPFLTGERSREEKISIISNCLNVKERLEKNRPHVKGGNQKASPYKEYKKIAGSRSSLSEKSFNAIYRGIEGITFNGAELNCSKKAVRASNALLSAGLSGSRLLQCLLALAETYSPEYAASSISRDPEENASILPCIRDAADLLKSNKANWVDTICYLSIDHSSNDIELENSLIYYMFTSRLVDLTGRRRRACVIDPSPFFVRKWLKDDPLFFVPVDFVFSDATIFGLVKSKFRQNENVNYYLLQDHLSRMKNDPPEMTLLFGSHIAGIEKKLEIIDALDLNTQKAHGLMIFDTDFMLTDPSSPVAKRIEHNIIPRIELFPAGIISNTRPQKKMLAFIKCGYIRAANTGKTHVVSHILDERGAYQRIKSKTLEIDVDLSERITQNVSLRKLFRDGSRKAEAKTNKKRSPNIKFEFSSEIQLRYTLFKGSSLDAVRIRATAHLIGPDGKRIHVIGATKEKKSIRSEDVEKWLNRTYPYEKIKDTSIREAIAADIRDTYEGKPITLKTFVYACPEIEEDLSPDALGFLRDAMDSYLGKMLVPMINADHLMFFIQDYSESDSAVDTDEMVSVFEEVFSTAIKYRQRSNNPASELTYVYRDRFKELDDIRNALAKTFLTVPEARKITSCCLKNIKKGNYVYLAVLLRLATGLGSNIISALFWSDISELTVDGTTFSYVHVERQLKGTDLTPLRRKEMVRDIPIPSQVASLLKNTMTLSPQLPDIQDHQFRKIPVVPGGNVLIDAGTALMSPDLINRRSSELIKKLNIPSDILPLPTNSHGITETELSRSRVDLYRGTFRHYIVRETDLNESEINYLMGVSASNVDYACYVDCSAANPRKQLLFYEAIQTVFNLFMEEK